MSNGVLVDPEYSNDWSWPDGHPSISFGPHGMGMDVSRRVVFFFFSFFSVGWVGCGGFYGRMFMGCLVKHTPVN